MKITKHTYCDTISNAITVPTRKEAYGKLQDMTNEIKALDRYKTFEINTSVIEYYPSKQGYRAFVLLTAYKK